MSSHQTTTATTRHQHSPTIALKPVTSPSDIPHLAAINEHALDSDPLKQWMARYTSSTEYDTTVVALTSALRDSNYRVVKAVVPDASTGSDDGEKIVGFVHWMCGYIYLEGGYGSAQRNCKKDVEGVGGSGQGVGDVKDPASDVAEVLAEESARLGQGSGGQKDQDDEARARRLKRGEAKYIDTRNHYIGAIRGKKHMFVRRLMVLPEFQGRGIGRKLMKVVTDDADRQKIVCWLFARPAGAKMYESFGFKVVSVTEMDEPEDGFTCPAGKGMMRSPQPVVID